MASLIPVQDISILSLLLLLLLILANKPTESMSLSWKGWKDDYLKLWQKGAALIGRRLLNWREHGGRLLSFPFNEA